MEFGNFKCEGASTLILRVFVLMTDGSAMVCSFSQTLSFSVLLS